MSEPAVAAAARPADDIVARLAPRDPATSVRPGVPADAPFRRALFDEERAAVFAALGDADRMRALLAQQYRAREEGYAHAFPHAAHGVIEHAGKPVGTLIVAVEPGGESVPQPGGACISSTSRSRRRCADAASAPT